MALPTDYASKPWRYADGQCGDREIDAAESAAIKAAAEKIGAHILASTPRESDGSIIVLAKIPGQHQPYATWLYCPERADGEPGGYFIWGHYFTDKMDACRDYNKRTDDAA